jgi:hypothetical protein
MIATMSQGRGAPRGKPQQGRRATFDAASGKGYRTGVSFPADVAEKVLKGAHCSDMSVSGLLADLVRRMPVDEQGRPDWGDCGWVAFPADVSEKLTSAAHATGVSASELLAALVRRMDVDATSGRPTWAGTAAEAEELRLAG